MLERASKLTLICASFAKGSDKGLINFKGLDGRCCQKDWTTDSCLWEELLAGGNRKYIDQAG